MIGDLVTAVVVTYNSETEITDCVRSIVESGIVDIVVVDNDSSDRSVHYATSAGARVVSISKNLGFGGGVNVGVGAVSTEYVLLVNPDCRISRETVAGLLETLVRDNGLAAVVPQMIYADGSPGISGGLGPSITKEILGYTELDRRFPKFSSFLLRSRFIQRMAPRLSSYRTDRFLSGSIDKVDWVSAFCLLISVDRFHVIGGFDESFFMYFEDVDLSARLRSRGFGVAIDRRLTAIHFESSSTNVVGKSRLYGAGMARYFSKHGSRLSALCSSALAKRMARE